MRTFILSCFCAVISVNVILSFATKLRIPSTDLYESIREDKQHIPAHILTTEDNKLLLAFATATAATHTTTATTRKRGLNMEDLINYVPPVLNLTEGGPAVINTNDKHVATQWYLDNDEFPPIHINLRRAWKMLDELKLKTEDVVVGVAHDGFQLQHLDLWKNIWKNPNEVLDGKDNDFNKCVDDIHGCDIAKMRGMTPSFIKDNSDFGTSAMGILAAVSDNSIGITGCSHRNNIKMTAMQVKLSRKTYGELTYALALGLRLSFFGRENIVPSEEMELALKWGMKYNQLSFWSGGDSYGGNLSAGCHDWPTTYGIKNIVAVSKIGKSGHVPHSSSVGPTKIHIAAPGEFMYTTVRGNIYGYRHGSSYAAILTTGVAGLILSAFPHFGAMQLKRVLLESYRRLLGLEPVTMYPGIPDAARAIQFALCEEEFEKAVQLCNPQASKEDAKFWYLSGPFNMTLALKCQAACEKSDCIQQQMEQMTHLCLHRYCDILDGVCEDERAYAGFALTEKLPSFKCDRCHKYKMMYSGVVEFRVLSSTQDSKTLSEMAESLRLSLLSVIPIFEATLDVWKAKVGVDEAASFVYRLSSNELRGVGRILSNMTRNSSSKIWQTAFFIKYCPLRSSCTLQYSSEYYEQPQTGGSWRRGVSRVLLVVLVLGNGFLFV